MKNFYIPFQEAFRPSAAGEKAQKNPLSRRKADAVFYIKYIT